MHDLRVGHFGFILRRRGGQKFQNIHFGALRMLAPVAGYLGFFCRASDSASTSLSRFQAHISYRVPGFFSYYIPRFLLIPSPISGSRNISRARLPLIHLSRIHFELPMYLCYVYNDILTHLECRSRSTHELRKSQGKVKGNRGNIEIKGKLGKTRDNRDHMIMLFRWRLPVPFASDIS